MSSRVLQRSAPLFLRARAVFPAFAFFGGFLWDAVTLGRSIQTLDLCILLAYQAAAGGILIWMGRRGSMRGGAAPVPGAGPTAPDASVIAAQDAAPPSGFKAWLRADGPAFALQFLFGSLFSALTIFYFLSSSYLPGFLLVSALVALLILNEFLESHYHRFTITWTLYGVSAILAFNFALPHAFGSIHPAWFFISTAAGVALVFLLKRLSPKARGSAWPTLGAALALVLLFLANAIPPVPLVKKRMVICRGLERVDGRYYGDLQKQPFYSFWRKSESVVRRRPGDQVFCFTSVFLPTGIQTTLYHRWRFEDPGTGAWVETSRIGFPIHGGRRDGFRGYTYKRNMAPGRWEVRVETASERVLGLIHFRVEASADSTMEFKKLLLE